MTLSFCLQDGTPLVEVRQSSVDTVSFTRPVTAEKILKTEDFSHLAIPKEVPQRARQFEPFPQPRRPQKKSHRGLMIGIASVLVFMIVSALAIFGWLYISNQRPALASAKPEQHEPYSMAPMNVSARPSDVVTTDAPADTAPSTPSVSPAKSDAVRREITSDIDGWKRAAETCNAADYVGLSGEKIE